MARDRHIVTTGLTDSVNMARNAAVILSSCKLSQLINQVCCIRETFCLWTVKSDDYFCTAGVYYYRSALLWWVMPLAILSDDSTNGRSPALESTPWRWDAPSRGDAATRRLHLTAGCTTSCVNYASPAKRRLSGPARTLMTSSGSRPARRLRGQQTMWRVWSIFLQRILIYLFIVTLGSIWSWGMTKSRSITNSTKL